MRRSRCLDQIRCAIPALTPPAHTRAALALLQIDQPATAEHRCPRRGKAGCSFLCVVPKKQKNPGKFTPLGLAFCFQPLLIQSPESTLSAISDTLCLAGLAGLAKDGHKPDKLDTWKYAPESDGWYRIHNALRGEMFKFEAVLEKLA